MPSDLSERRRKSGAREEEPARPEEALDRAYWRAYYRLLGQRTGDTLRDLLARREADRVADWDRFKRALKDLSPPLVRAIESEVRREGDPLRGQPRGESLTPR